MIKQILCAAILVSLIQAELVCTYVALDPSECDDAWGCTEGYGDEYIYEWNGEVNDANDYDCSNIVACPMVPDSSNDGLICEADAAAFMGSGSAPLSELVGGKAGQADLLRPAGTEYNLNNCFGDFDVYRVECGWVTTAIETTADVVDGIWIDEYDQVRYNVGFVCDDAFSIASADMVCKEANGPSYEAVSFNTGMTLTGCNTEGGNGFSLDNVVCTDGDMSLDDCTSTEEDNCTCGEGVTVTCGESPVCDGVRDACGVCDGDGSTCVSCRYDIAIGGGPDKYNCDEILAMAQFASLGCAGVENAVYTGVCDGCSACTPATTAIETTADVVSNGDPCDDLGQSDCASLSYCKVKMKGSGAYKKCKPQKCSSLDEGACTYSPHCTAMYRKNGSYKRCSKN